jgi:hypothetical protein
MSYEYEVDIAPIMYSKLYSCLSMSDILGVFNQMLDFPIGTDCHQQFLRPELAISLEVTLYYSLWNQVKRSSHRNVWLMKMKIAPIGIIRTPLKSSMDSFIQSI